MNIVNPSPAPDPTGLGAALALLGTPNIFRDMSGRQEVADLLKKLSDNTIAIAEAANRAREIQAKYGTDLDKNEKDLALGKTQADADVAKAMLQQRREEAQQVKPNEAQDAIKLSENEMKKGNVSPEEHKAYTKQQLSNVPGSGPKQPRLIKLDIEMKYPDGATLSGNFLFTIEDIDGDGQVVKESHSVFPGSRLFTVRMRGQRLRIYINGYDSILPPEQTGNVAIRFFDSSGTVTIPASGDHFLVRAVPSGVIETKVTAKSKADAETKATTGGKISAKEIIEISQGREVTEGQGTETTYAYTVKHYTRGLAFSLIV